MERSKNNLLKIAYFDEISAVDYLNVFNGGIKSTEETANRGRKADAEATGEVGAGTGILSKLIEPFVSIKAEGSLKSQIGTFGENIVRTSISNTVLSDYLSIANDDQHVEKISPQILRAYPNSITSVMMYTPLLKLFDFKGHGFDFSLFDETLEKIKGYLELIAELEDGSQKVLRFNNLAFRNNYKLVDLTRMNLTFYCVKVGEMTLDQLDPQNEFSLIQNESILDRNEITQESGEKTRTNPVPFYDVVLAGIMPDE